MPESPDWHVDKEETQDTGPKLGLRSQSGLHSAPGPRRREPHSASLYNGRGAGRRLPDETEAGARGRREERGAGRLEFPLAAGAAQGREGGAWFSSRAAGRAGRGRGAGSEGPPSAARSHAGSSSAPPAPPLRPRSAVVWLAPPAALPGSPRSQSPLLSSLSPSARPPRHPPQPPFPWLPLEMRPELAP